MNIRKATKDDIEGIVDLNRLLNRQHVLLDSVWVGGDQVDSSFRERLASDMSNASVLHLVTEESGKLIGWLAGSIEDTQPHFSEKRIGHIWSAFVLPEFRKQGITKASMEMMFQWFKENGINLAELSVASGNKEGIAAWERLGFLEYKKRMKREI
jgi:ribosomal protein S18 acetylase RimI-like enzyme